MRSAQLRLALTWLMLIVNCWLLPAAADADAIVGGAKNETFILIGFVVIDWVSCRSKLRCRTYYFSFFTKCKEGGEEKNDLFDVWSPRIRKVCCLQPIHVTTNICMDAGDAITIDRRLRRNKLRRDGVWRRYCRGRCGMCACAFLMRLSHASYSF